MNCPICDKAGLSEDAASCPQCNSDLSGFLYIEKIAVQQNRLGEINTGLYDEVKKEKLKKRNVIILSSFFLIVLLGFMLWFFTSYDLTKVDIAYKLKADSLSALVVQNEAEINRLVTKNQELKEKQNVIKYVVKKGDNLIKIARFFYHDASLYWEIMSENNIEENATLFVGDTLTLKLKN